MNGSSQRTWWRPAPLARGVLRRLAGVPSPAARLREQAAVCRRLGSTFCAFLLERAADDAAAGGPAADVLDGHELDRGRTALALRFLAAVHRRVLEGAAPDLARFYPTAGGEAAEEPAWRALRGLLAEQRREVRRLLERPVQTNEIGRAAALAAGFSVVGAETGLPLRLLEVGASAGLNLRADAYAYDWGGRTLGDPDSPVRIGGRWIAGDPPVERLPAIVERLGCDLSPIDPASEEGRMTLLSCVWADQPGRLATLRAALAIAGRVPAPVERAPAGRWLRRVLAEPVRGAATIVYHAIVMPYLSPRQREHVRALIFAAGARATPRAPLAWLRFEIGGEEARLHVTTWPRAAGRSRLLAEASFHGAHMRWVA